MKHRYITHENGFLGGVEWLVLVFLPLFLLSCVSYNDFDTTKAEGSYGLAKALQKDSRYDEALLQYKSLKTYFPYSHWSVEADLEMANILFAKGSFLEAQGSYELFKELHPKHKKIDYVSFRIGESIDKQIPSSVDRDVSLAWKAIEAYQFLIQKFPRSSYVDQAWERIRKNRGKLAKKQLYIADFYYRTGHWLSALFRYNMYLEKFPKDSHRPRALLYAGYSAHELGKTSEKNRFFTQLMEKYPKTLEAQKAREGMHNEPSRP